MRIETRGFMGGGKALQDLGREIGLYGLPETIPPAAAKTVQVQKSLAPIRTGFLVNNIGYTANGKQVHFFSRARYSMYVENGTWKMPARPFFFGPIFTVFPQELKNEWMRFRSKFGAKLGSGARSTP